MSMLPPISLGVLLLGISFLALGLRGRRIGDEPRCRKCGYNLTGIAAVRCPECGRLLTARRIRSGRRIRRRGFLLMGLGLVGSVLAMRSAFLQQAVGLLQLERRMPVEGVLFCATLGSQTAFNELVRRAESTATDPDESARILRYALDRFEDASPPAGARWSLVIHALRTLPAFDQATNERFHRHAWQAKYTTRPRVRQGDPLPVRSTRRSRVDESLGWSSEVEVAGVASADRILQARGAVLLPRAEMLLGRITTGDTQVLLPTLPVGTHRLDLIVHSSFGWVVGATFGGPNITVEEKVPVTVEILAAGADDPPRELSPRIGALLQSGILIDPVQVAGGSRERLVRVRVSWAAKSKLPVALAARLLLRAGGVEYHVGDLVWRPGTTPNTQFAGRTGPWTGTSVAIVLRPSPEIARRQVDYDTIWGRELVFEPIAVEDAPPATPPLDSQKYPWGYRPGPSDWTTSGLAEEGRPRADEPNGD